MAKNAGLSQLEATLELYLVKKAPFQLPSNAKEIIVKFIPWVNLVLIVFALPILVALLGLQALLTPFATLGGGYGYSLPSQVLAVAALVFEALAINGLFAKSQKGWRYLYFATLLGFLSGVANFHIVNALVNAVIGLYFLFQIKSYYK